MLAMSRNKQSYYTGMTPRIPIRYTTGTDEGPLLGWMTIVDTAG